MEHFKHFYYINNIYMLLRSKKTRKNRKRKQLYGGDDHEAIVKNCSGLGECDDDIIKFSETINNENCPFQEEKIKQLVKCYNKNNKKSLSIDITKNSLMELLDTQEDINDLEKATEWLEAEIEKPREALTDYDKDLQTDDDEFKPREALFEKDILNIGGRKSRKSRKTKKPRKSRKSRKTRKSRK
jgi:hypothetical protein